MMIDRCIAVIVLLLGFDGATLSGRMKTYINSSTEWVTHTTHQEGKAGHVKLSWGEVVKIIDVSMSGYFIVLVKSDITIEYIGCASESTVLEIEYQKELSRGELVLKPEGGYNLTGFDEKTLFFPLLSCTVGSQLKGEFTVDIALPPKADRSPQQKKSALAEFPGLLETVSFCFVPTAFISGPQFPMRHYKAFVDGTLRPYGALLDRSFLQRSLYNVKVHRTLIRLTMGLLGIVVLAKLITKFPAEFMLTDEFQHQWWWTSRIVYMAIFSEITLFRYVAVWLIGEGSCVLLGLGCTGLVHIRTPPDSANGNEAKVPGTDAVQMRTTSALNRRDSAVTWNQCESKLDDLGRMYDQSKLQVYEAEHTACANISLGNLLLATNTDGLVTGFNINTNRWMLDYVYKRLRFLNNKMLSQIVTLSFLALWHGLYTGYFVNFALEFMTMAVEKDLLSIVKRSKYREFLYNSRAGFILTSVVGKLHVVFMLCTPLTAFYLLQYHLWFPVLKSTYFIGCIYFIWPALRPIFKRVFPMDAQLRKPTIAAHGDLANGTAHTIDASEVKKSQ